MSKEKKKERNGMVFLAENGEGTDWMSVAEYSARLSEKIGSFKKKELASNGNAPVGRPKKDAEPRPVVMKKYTKGGPTTPQAIYYRISKGHLEKKVLYGKLTVVREPKK